jgi:general secretion pathway protein E
MSFLNSESLLDLLVSEQVLSSDQRQYVILHKGKQRQRLLKQYGGRRHDDELRQSKGFPDMVDIVASFGLVRPGPEQQSVTEEVVMRAVSHGLKIPFKKLDPLELDMATVTKTIPRSFAVNHLIVPFDLCDGVLSVVTYYPDNHHVLEDIEKANQVKVRPFLSTRTDITKIQGEFFGF